MFNSLKNRVAIVTGGAGGIGKATCEALSCSGAQVIVSDVNLKAAERLSQELNARGSKSIAVEANVTLMEDMDKLVISTLREFGKLDIMVNNAGVNSLAKVEDMMKEEWDRVMDINLWGVFLGCKFASEPMKKQNYGKIINISSLNAKGGGIFSGMNYTASKAGVWAITKSFAKLLAPYRINVNAICPGPTDTPFHRELTEEQRLAILKPIPLGRWGKPEDIAGAVLFFASNLSDYITGAALDVNGGLLMYQDQQGSTHVFTCYRAIDSYYDDTILSSPQRALKYTVCKVNSVSSVIYEWRIYDTHPGMLPALLERFREGEMRLFEKHGIKIVGFWTNLIGGESGVLYYMVGYKDLADREKCWKGFRSDPEWQKMKEKSEREGPLVSKVRNMLLEATDFSPLKQSRENFTPNPNLNELCLVESADKGCPMRVHFK